LAKIVTDPPYVPGTLTVGNPTVSPSQVSAGTPVTISCDVSNTGDVKAAFDVTLIINGDPLDTKTVTLDARAAATVQFVVTEKTAGTYVASINAKHNVTFTVK
jgi:archaellum component FlaG (FlaF/FlaG flagellin family)